MGKILKYIRDTLLPETVNRLNSRGISLGDRGRYSESETEFKKALAMEPKNSMTLNNYGILLKRMKHYSEALKYYDLAVMYNPKDGSAWFNRAVVLRELGREDESEESWWKSLGISLSETTRLYDALQ